MPHTRLFWIAMGLVGVMAALFAAYFIAYKSSVQDAYLTSAEDFGIMNQAIWSITHGELFHQTICNIVSDTNCYSLNGISRFAIHFEPILFPVSVLYLLWPDPKMLYVIQEVIVASGAFPAFWLARLRLRNEFAAAGIALLYLLYPAQQQATNFDFHAVTFTAALLLYTLYFMYTRQTVWLFVFAILSMACKEEIPLVIAFFGLWTMVFQQRWRTGLGLVGLAIFWVGMTLLIYHLFSPTGRPLLASRYAYLGNGPPGILKNIVLHPFSLLYQHVLEHTHRQYLRILLAPAGYLPLLAPWVLVLAVPSLALNLFSSDPNQYLGVFQYSAEIVPVLIFSTIEAIVVLVWLARWIMKKVGERQEQVTSQTEEYVQTAGVARGANGWQRWVQPGMIFLLTIFVLLATLRQDVTYGALPFSNGIKWPHTSPHTVLAQQFVNMIPPSASVSAQSNLVPHISQRTSIYLFPYGDDYADYIFLDVTSATYPFESGPYITEVKKVLLGGHYGVVAAQDGYVLLKRGLTPPGVAPYSPAQSGDGVIPNLPESFCSFVYASPQDITHPVQVDFSPASNTGSSISLLGYSVAPPSDFMAGTRFMQVTAYWRVNTANIPPLKIQTLLYNQQGKQEFSSIDFPAISWCPTSTWKPGMIIRTQSQPLYIGNLPLGLVHVGLSLLPFDTPFGTIRAVTDRLPLRIVRAPATVTQVQGQNTLLINSFTI